MLRFFSRDGSDLPAQKLRLEEFTPLQIGEAVVPQAPVQAREEVWRLVRRAAPRAPQFSWLLDAVCFRDALAMIRPLRSLSCAADLSK
jgi:hypothetical protein